MKRGVQRAVIPAAGFGTRILPATKSMPKEMLPVVDRPVIQYVVEEAVASGLRDVLVITGRTKRAIEDHFDESPELEALLERTGKKEALARVTAISSLGRIFYARQSRPRGLGHAVLQAEPHVAGAPFAVLLGDDILLGEKPATRQLLDRFEDLQASVLCVQEVPAADVSRYGIVDAEYIERGLYRVRDIVEKPRADEAPSRLATIGRYVFTPTILNHLARVGPGVNNEIQLTDAIRTLLREEEVYCSAFEGVRYDVGSIGGWLEANLELALADPLHRGAMESALRKAGYERKA